MKVLVVGNCTIDRSFRVPRFPRPGETLLANSSEIDAGGKGANQALASARTGAAVTFCAAVGNDPEGVGMRSQLAREGVDLAYVLKREGGTDQSIIYLTPSGENCIVSSHTLADSVTPDDTTPVLDSLETGDILLMQGNLSFETTHHCLQEAYRRGARVVLNPAPIHYSYDSLWKFIHVSILNEVENATVSGVDDPDRGARVIISKGARLVITTLGDRGAKVVGTEIEQFIDAEQVRVIDTTGAGDVFCGVFAGGLATGLSPQESAEWAVRAATLSVTRRGTQRSFPLREELSALLRLLRQRGA
jgi:ribokinase